MLACSVWASVAAAAAFLVGMWGGQVIKRK